MTDPAEVLRRHQEIIDRVGWVVTHVIPGDEDDHLMFADTAGLTAHGFPELAIAGLPPEVAHTLLNDLAGRVYDRAERFRHGQPVSDLLAGYDAVIVDGPADGPLFAGAAIGLYGAERVRLQQVVWPDRDGRFPWDDRCALPAGLQPVIGRP